MNRICAVVAMVVLTAGLGVACANSGPTDELKKDVVANYAAGVHHLYSKSLASAVSLDGAIDRFLADPTSGHLEAAKRQWLIARDDYGLTEAFRFYDGPIDHPENGPEGLINAWPLDESYIDYVEGNATGGIVNNPADYPSIDADLLVSLNEEGGEANVSTGWHAIEFLLWGQDLSANGPGERPLEDFTTNQNSDRRAAYLSVTSDLLITHLQQLVDAWAPGRSDNFRATFVSADADDAIQKIITGIGELSRGELAGERMTVAFEERSQEDEHSCFSDNTTADIIANARGIQMVFLGEFGAVSGPGIDDLVAAKNEELAEQLTAQIRISVSNATDIPVPFDQHLSEGVSDQGVGRRAVLTTITSLENQTDSIVNAAQEIGITISVS